MEKKNKQVSLKPSPKSASIPSKFPLFCLASHILTRRNWEAKHTSLSLLFIPDEELKTA